MEIKAKFKGTNSLGYENGKNYILEFNVQQGQVWIHPVDYRCKPCAYHTLKSFLNNWQVF